MKFKQLTLLLSSILILVSANLLAIPQIGQKLEDQVGVYFNWKEYSLNLRFINNRFHLFFVDKEGLITKPPVEFATIRYESRRHRYAKDKGSTRLKTTRKQRELYTLLSSSGSYLTSERVVVAPLVYWVTLALQKPTNDKKDKFEPIVVFPRTVLNQLPEAEQPTIELYDEDDEYY